MKKIGKIKNQLTNEEKLIHNEKIFRSVSLQITTVLKFYININDTYIYKVISHPDIS